MGSIQRAANFYKHINREEFTVINIKQFADGPRILSRNTIGHNYTVKKGSFYTGERESAILWFRLNY